MANVWQPGQVALAVPKTLVVTLEKVLGDETIGMLVKFHQCEPCASSWISWLRRIVLLGVQVIACELIYFVELSILGTVNLRICKKMCEESCMSKQFAC